MASPLFSPLRVTITAILSLSFCATASATTFPLSIPTRSTTFPLSRPALVGEVVAWGSNTFGQITIPPTATNVCAIATGPNHNLAVRADGTVVAWGDNQFGQCNVPQGLTGIVAVAGAEFHSLALRSDGRVFAWGTNDARIVVPSTLTDAVGIAADRYASYALRRDGTVIRWMDPNKGSPSFGTVSNTVAIRGHYIGIVSLDGDGKVYIDGTPFRQMNSVAYIGTCQGLVGIVRTDGVVYSSYLDNPPPGLRAGAVACASYNYALAAITADSSVAVWSTEERPVLSVLTNTPPRLRGVIAIEGGETHFIAIRIPTPPIPSIANASAQVVNGFVVGLNIIDGGEGYATPPKATISGGNGSGATATAQINKGIVTGFTMTNAGIGYTSTPTVEIEPPPFLPTLGIATSRVNVTMQVVPGKRYQLESSNDLPNFGPVGAPFIADKDTFTQEFTVSETGQYFRIEEVP